MFKRNTRDTSDLDELIEDACCVLRQTSEDSDHYAAALSSLERLEKLRERRLASNSIDRNVLLTVGGNLAGILLILGYEHAHVITSRAFATFVKHQSHTPRTGK